MKKFKILIDDMNSLLGFRDVELEVEFEKTPLKKEAMELICEGFKAKEENCVLKRISGSFGTTNFKISARVYPNAEVRDKFELRKKKKKKSKGK